MTDKPKNPLAPLLVVLIVEDDDLLRALLAEVVADMDTKVYTESTADDGLRAFHDHPELALIISDVVTPGEINGWDLTLRVHDERPGLPVILTSGYYPPNEMKLPESACFLRKPWSLDEMCSLVRSRLDTKR